MGTHKMSDKELRELDRRSQVPFIELKTTVRELKRVVTGFNGDTGLKGRAEKAELAMIDLKKGQADIKLLLIGDETNVNDTGGLKGKQRELEGNQRDIEKSQKAITRFFWIVLGIGISGISSLVLFLIQQRILAVAATAVP